MSSLTEIVVASRSDDVEVARKRRVHQRLLTVPVGAMLDEPGAAGALRARLAELLRDEAPLLSAPEFERTLTELADEVMGLGPLEPVLADPSVTEVMINGPGRCFVEREGNLSPIALELDAAAILRIVERVVAPLGLRLDRSSPIVDARLPDGSRLHAVIPPLAIDGPCVTIRRFGARAVTLDAFAAGADATAFLHWAVRAGWNLVVSGGTGAGKTTLLNTLSSAIDARERIVTIEETAELRLAQPHVVRLEARPSNAEGVGGVSVRDLVRAALRMRPDRLVVGEVRGGEALDMLQALNTGHDGSLSTVHANSAPDALTRLETLVLLAGVGLPVQAVRAQLAASVDAVVHVARRRGVRTIDTVGELVADAAGELSLRPLLARTAGELVPVGSPTRPSRRHEGDPPDPRMVAC